MPAIFAPFAEHLSTRRSGPVHESSTWPAAPGSPPGSRTHAWAAAEESRASTRVSQMLEVARAASAGERAADRVAGGRRGRTAAAGRVGRLRALPAGLQFFPDRAAALREMLRVARAGRAPGIQRVALARSQSGLRRAGGGARSSRGARRRRRSCARPSRGRTARAQGAGRGRRLARCTHRGSHRAVRFPRRGSCSSRRSPSSPLAGPFARSPPTAREALARTHPGAARRPMTTASSSHGDPRRDGNSLALQAAYTIRVSAR